MKYTWEQILESQEFEHGQEFIKAEEVTLILNTIFARLLPVSNFGQVKNIASDLKKIISDLNQGEGFDESMKL